MIDNQNYYAETRQAVRVFWAAYHKLKDSQTQWNALDYGNTLADGTGPNIGLTKTDLGSAVFDTTNAVTNLLSQGHATNLAKLL